MKIKGKYILLGIKEFGLWLRRQEVTRTILLIQLHHTWVPSYSHFNKKNHFELCTAMENAHLQRGFSEIAQNFTTFPDGKIMVCRNLNKIPAGIKGANTNGICIENVGNFDAGMDIMTTVQRDTIILMTRAFLEKFGLEANENSVVYHHWYDLTLGTRIPAEGEGDTKSCPGTAFFGGNTINAFTENLLPELRIVHGIT